MHCFGVFIIFRFLFIYGIPCSLRLWLGHGFVEVFNQGKENDREPDGNIIAYSINHLIYFAFTLSIQQFLLRIHGPNTP